MHDLKDQVVFITGASSGIGAALARQCARAGAHVALTARRADRLSALAAELQAMGRRALALPADVTRDGELEAAVAAATEQLGGIDIAVANAGFGVTGPIARLSLDDVRRQFETNVFGVVRTVHATLPALLQRRGKLVLVGSVAAYLNPPGVGAYSMSKAAVMALAETLRLELRPQGVTVTLISPGFIESEIRQVDNQGHLQEGAQDPVPSWLVMPTETAAKKIVRAIARGDAEAVLTLHGKIGAALGRHAPGLRGLLLDRSPRKHQ